MSQSNAKPTREMSREELEQEVAELRERVADLEEAVDKNAEKPGRISVNMLFESLVGGEIDDYSADPMEHRETIETFRSEFEELLATVETLENRMAVENTKRDKVAAIVRYADNQRDSHQGVVRVTPKEICGATGVSERYAYDLCDKDEGLPDEYSWIVSQPEMEESQYGNIEKNMAGKALGVDFEGVHGTRCPLNKFNNDSRTEAGNTTQEVSET